MCGFAVLIVLVFTLPPLTVSLDSARTDEPGGPSIQTPAASLRPHFATVVAGADSLRTLAVDGEAYLLPVGAEHRVTNNASPQNEVSIALNPRNPRNIVVGANDYRPGNLWCGVYTSVDGGRTWIEQLVPRNGSLSLAEMSGDPSVAFDADGNAYVTCIGVEGWSFVAIAKSTDGGLTWGTPRQVVAAEPDVIHDKSYMAVDTSTAPTRGNVYVTWTRFLYDSLGQLIESPIYFSRSTDGGTTWSAEKEISDPGGNLDQGSQPAVGPAGELYVSWAARTGTDKRVAVTKSMDGGLTWGPTVIVNTLDDPGPLYPVRPRTSHLPSIVVNPIDASGGNRVHIVWADRRFGDADIVMSTSVDGGVTWEAPVKANDDATANAQFFPWVAASTNGKVFVAFYDRRDDPGDRLLTVYVTMSTDFGVSFGRNQRVSAQFDPGTSFIGDYIGIAASGDSAYPAWCDLRNGGEREIYMAGPLRMDPTIPPTRVP